MMAPLSVVGGRRCKDSDAWPRLLILRQHGISGAFRAGWVRVPVSREGTTDAGRGYGVGVPSLLACQIS